MISLGSWDHGMDSNLEMAKYFKGLQGELGEVIINYQ